VCGEEGGIGCCVGFGGARGGWRWWGESLEVGGYGVVAGGPGVLGWIVEGGELVCRGLVGRKG